MKKENKLAPWNDPTVKWVCENHPTKEQSHRIWLFFRCGGAGMPESTEENIKKGYIKLTNMPHKTFNAKELRQEWNDFAISINKTRGVMQYNSLSETADWWLSKLSLVEEKTREDALKNIGMLRQWLNEDRITNPNKMVTNEKLKSILSIK